MIGKARRKPGRDDAGEAPLASVRRKPPQSGPGRVLRKAAPGRAKRVLGGRP